MSIWETLSAIDCSEHIEKKGQFSYLAWTWAWAMVKQNYPTAHYAILDDIVYPDGTMEVRVAVTMGDELVRLKRSSTESLVALTHTMWLPVLDFKNKPIPNPNAFDINTARMRCLVKCLAMFGLGHYIYAGESAPAPSPASMEDYEELVGLVAAKSIWGLRRFYDLKADDMDGLFNLAPEGKKTSFKNSVREVYGLGSKQIKTNIAALEEAVSNPESEHSVEDIYNDAQADEWDYTLRGCNEILRHQIEEALS